jgi:ankyrin repeat protein
MSEHLPLRANIEWLKKLCKERLAGLRAIDPSAKLSAVQLAVAREYGFPSWRKLQAHVEQLREELQELAPAATSQGSAVEAISADDAELAQLLVAVEQGNTQTVTELLAQRPGLARGHGPDGQTPLHVAAQCNDPRLGVLLLAYGADPEATFGQSSHTALSWAVTCNAMEFARAMLRLGIKPDLFCAAGIGSVESARACFDESGNLRGDAVRSGSTRYGVDGTRLPCPPQNLKEQIADALYIACRNAHEDVVRFLLTKEPDLSFRAYMGGTPLHWAYFGGSRRIIDLLQQAGADTTARDLVLGCTPRMFGICAPANWGFAFLVQKRLAEDPSLANVTDGRTSPLHEAARSGSTDVVKLLLDCAADPKVRNGDGKTPLEIAAESGHPGVVDMLNRAIEAGHEVAK